MSHRRASFVTALILLSLVFPTTIVAQTTPPSIRFFVGDKPADQTAGVTVAELTQLSIRAIPDSTFADSHPNDVYSIGRWRLYVRKGSTLGNPQEGSGESLYPSIIRMAQKGDAITLEIEHVTHTDSNGHKEEVKLDSKGKYLSIGVK